MPGFAFSDPKNTGSALFGVEKPSIDYTAWDYASLKVFLATLAEKHFGERFNNFVESDGGIMLMEYLAARGDALSFKIDMAVNEAFYTTATLDKSIRRHARRWSYRPLSTTAARYDFAISSVAPYDVDIVIPAGYQVSVGGADGRTLFVELFLAGEDGNPIFGQDIVFPAGVTSITNVVGIEGQSTTIQSTGTGQAFQVINIPQQNVIPDSVLLEVDDVIWERVESIYEKGQNNVFVVDQDDRTGQWYVITGDDIRGSVIPSGSTGIVRYRTGGGQRGNVPAGFISKNHSISVAGSGLTAILSFVNRSRGYGGGDAESSEQIRRNLPQWIKSQGRLVHLDDYTLHAGRFFEPTVGRVAKARAYLRHAGCAANVINVYALEYVAENTPGTPSDRLIRGLRESMEDIADCTHHICVKPGAIVPVDVRLHAVMPSSMSGKRSQLESMLRSALDSYFSLNLWNLGMPLSPRDLTRYLSYVVREGSLDVHFDTYPGYEIEADGGYKARHWELVRPQTIEVNVDFSSEILDGRLT